MSRLARLNDFLDLRSRKDSSWQVDTFYLVVAITALYNIIGNIHSFPAFFDLK